MSDEKSRAFHNQNEVKFWVGVLICPLTFLTMVKVIHFSYKSKLLLQSVDLLLILSVVFLTAFTSTYFNYYIETTNRLGDSYTYISVFYAYSYLIFPISTYLFAFKYFNSVNSIVRPGEPHFALKGLKYVFWFAVPFVNLVLAITFMDVNSKVQIREREHLLHPREVKEP